MLLEDVTLAQVALVAVTAFLASIVAGVAGYGTGLLMPLVLVPIIGAEAVVPVIGLSALLTNGSRLAAYRGHCDWRLAWLVITMAIPTCMLGAWGYTKLTSRGAQILIGTVLLLLVPGRRLLKRAAGELSRRAMAGASVGYGFLLGGTTGSGVLLLSMLMAAGLGGPAVIATDAAISMVLGVFKSGVFQWAGALPLSSWILALIIGGMSVPGAFIARWLSRHFPLHVHNAILDGAVLVGGGLMILRAL